MKIPLSPRRRAIYLSLFALALLINFVLLRIRPRLGELSRLQQGELSLREQVRTLAGEANLRETAALERRVGTLARRLAKERAESKRLGLRLANTAQAGELAVQVSALADEVGLRVERVEAVAHTAPRRGHAQEAASPGPGNLEPFLREGPYARPMRSWTVAGSYEALRSFLTKLETLPWQAVVVRLEVDRPQHTGRYEPPLRIHMTVAL